ncbi:MAG: hypothetical protein WA941_08505, partial [Nitrososphaeraceae archaeon]
ESEYFPTAILKNSLSQVGKVLSPAERDTKYIIITFNDYSYFENNIHNLRKLSKNKNIMIIGIPINLEIVDKAQFVIDGEPAFQICRLSPKDIFKIENNDQVYFTLNSGKIIAKFAGDLDETAMGIIETF